MSARTDGHGAYSKKICKKNAEADRKVRQNKASKQKMKAKMPKTRHHIGQQEE